LINSLLSKDFEPSALPQMFQDGDASVGRPPGICVNLRHLRQPPGWPKIVVDFGPPIHYIRIYTIWCAFFEKLKAFNLQPSGKGQHSYDLACAKRRTDSAGTRSAERPLINANER